jgi:hypothetical protein
MVEFVLLLDVYKILENSTKWIKNVQIVLSFILKYLKKFGLISLTCSKGITLLVFTKFTCDLLEVRHLVRYSR